MDEMALYANPWTVAASAAFLSAIGAFALRGSSPRRKGESRVSLGESLIGTSAQLLPHASGRLAEPVAFDAGQPPRPRERELEQKLGDQQRALESMERALVRERDLCTEMQNACPAFLVLLDPDDRIARINPALCSALGYAERELVGRNYWSALAPDSAATERSSTGGSPAASSAELRLRCASGETILVEWRWRVLRDERGLRRSRLGVGIDVTESRREKDWLAAQQEQLIEAERLIALGTLMSGLAHEISNPNQVIQINVPLLEQSWGRLPAPLRGAQDALHAEVPQMLREVLVASDRIQRIVGELHAYARGESTCTMGQVALNDVVDSALTLISSTVRRATRCFSVHCAQSLPPVWGDLRRLEQVLINLILNAAQALTDRCQAIRVQTYLDAEREELVLSVSDEGVGIRPENLTHIHAPYFTTKQERGGTGLGLAVAQHIAELHGGRIELESELGMGTTASLRLPTYRPTSQD